MKKETESWHALDGDAVVAKLETDRECGLTTQEAARRLLEYGSNVLTSAAVEGPWSLLLRQVNNPIGWLLLGAGTIAVFLNKATDAAVVFGAVGINAAIGCYQEYRSGKTIAALSALVPENSTLVRDGQLIDVQADTLAPGDIVTLQSGDKVPADLRLLRVSNLLIQEAALTGESLPVVKRIEAAASDAPLGDRFGMVYSGTLVLKGTATGVVVATGSDTELGRINVLLNLAVCLETPLTRQLAKVSAGITVAVVGVVALLLGFGIWIKHAPVAEALMIAVSLAVAAIPEGLPAVITIALVMGVRRMAERHVVVRYLPAVETLGSTTVICSDKTGTLTRNEMTVQVAWSAGHEYRFSGIGYGPEGELSSDGLCLAALPPDLEDLLTCALLCNDAAVRNEGGGWLISGDPTEAALVVAAGKGGLDFSELRRSHPRLDVIPFGSDTAFMATLHRFCGKNRILIKGAPETILRRCLLTAGERSRVQTVVESHARQGLRIIACAHVCVRGERILPEEVTSGLVFDGLMGMLDPPRTEAMDAIGFCHRAGITVKMITGDHPLTAETIGRQLGLLEERVSSVQGRDLDALSPQQLENVIMNTAVFARVAPEHKIKLVEALQAAGEVVAMTGDGVNDAPALKQADIGIAMGITGTAVSREAAKIILVDDNFASIAGAVEEGRRVYDNLIKSLAFVLPTNLGLACILSVSVFFFPTVLVDGLPVLLLAMSPTQTLWINLVASITLSVPLAFEVLEPGAMLRPPRSPDEPVFSGFIILRLILVAGLMTVSGCGLFLWEYYRVVDHAPLTALLHARAQAEAQTLCVTGITFTQCFYLLNCRSLRNSIFTQGAFSNPAVFIGIGMLLLLQASFIYLPLLQNLFNSAPLTIQSCFNAMLAGSVVLPVISCEKWFRAHW
jgi:magnesium-transporting ATPase (P-type)